MTQSTEFYQVLCALALLKEKHPLMRQLDALHNSGLLMDLLDANLSQVDRNGFREYLGLPPVVFSVTDSCSKSLEESIAAGHYDRRDPHITSERFEIRGYGSKPVLVELVQFTRLMSSEEIEAEICGRGLQLGSISELLALGASFPELQREAPIVALGSVAKIMQYDHAPCLTADGSERCLYTKQILAHWPSGYRFLAVCC